MVLNQTNRLPSLDSWILNTYQSILISPSSLPGNNTLTVSGGKVHADWSGVRAIFGLGFKLDEKQRSTSGAVSLGFGAGLDYGGFGANLLMYPHDNLGVFIGAGYAIAGFGTNGGVKIRLNNGTKTRGYVLGMYGYNAAISVSSTTTYNKLFYGPTVGAGIDLKPGLSGHWSMGVLVPFRNSDVDEYINFLKSQGARFKNVLLPITLTVGFRFVSDNKGI